MRHCFPASHGWEAFILPWPPAAVLHRHNPIQFWNVILEFRAAKAVHGAGDDGQLGADNALFQIYAGHNGPDECANICKSSELRTHD